MTRRHFYRRGAHTPGHEALEIWRDRAICCRDEIPRGESCMRSAQFRFARAVALPALRCWRHAVFYRPVFRRALQVAAVVGTILFLINQLDVVLTGKVTPVVVLKIALIYLVPFLVSTYSALEINRLRQNSVVRELTSPAAPGAAA